MITGQQQHDQCPGAGLSGLTPSRPVAQWPFSNATKQPLMRRCASNSSCLFVVTARHLRRSLSAHKFRKRSMPHHPSPDKTPAFSPGRDLRSGTLLTSTAVSTRARPVRSNNRRLPPGWCRRREYRRSITSTGAAAHVLRRPHAPVEVVAIQLVAVAGSVQVAGLQRKIQFGQQPACGYQPAVHDGVNQRIGAAEAGGDGFWPCSRVRSPPVRGGHRQSASA